MVAAGALFWLVAMAQQYLGWRGDVAFSRGSTFHNPPGFDMYLVALVCVGVPVLIDALKAWRRLDFRNEYTLMLLAAVGAFLLGEYAESVAVLLFYGIGEALEEGAAGRVRARIRRLVTRMPCEVTVEGRGTVRPEDVVPGDVMRVGVGSRVALDGVVQSPDGADFDCSALTGESVPVHIPCGGEVRGGSVPVDRAVSVRAVRNVSESYMARVMRMVEESASRKSRTETVLRRVTAWYTPAVMLAAVLLVAVPWLVSLVAGGGFGWATWCRRALVLLVCSCPCALVVSVPLAYFMGIGRMARIGILLKGSDSIDALARMDRMMFDKTGTVTTGKFRVRSVMTAPGTGRGEVLGLAAAVDADSSHPLARAICGEVGVNQRPEVHAVTSVPHGLTALCDGDSVVVGSRRLLERSGIRVPAETAGAPDDGCSEVMVARDGKWIGTIMLEDELKDDAAETIAALRRAGIREVGLLSGDRAEAVRSVGSRCGADISQGGMLPADKHREIALRVSAGQRVAFVGDGINDAPTLAAAMPGIAIGTGGTDMAVDSADAVLTGTGLAPLVGARTLARRVGVTAVINIALAIGVKLLVMILGAFGIATLWGAVFADTGILLVTVLITFLMLGRR